MPRVEDCWCSSGSVVSIVAVRVIVCPTREDAAGGAPAARRYDE
jgi:hypothetical protein